MRGKNYTSWIVVLSTLDLPRTLYTVLDSSKPITKKYADRYYLPLDFIEINGGEFDKYMICVSVNYRKYPHCLCAVLNFLFRPKRLLLLSSLKKPNCESPSNSDVPSSSRFKLNPQGFVPASFDFHNSSSSCFFTILNLIGLFKFLRTDYSIWKWIVVVFINQLKVSIFFLAELCEFCFKWLFHQVILSF